MTCSRCIGGRVFLEWTPDGDVLKCLNCGAFRPVLEFVPMRRPIDDDAHQPRRYPKYGMVKLG